MTLPTLSFLQTLVVALLVVVTPIEAWAQAPAAPDSAKLLPRYDFAMSAALLGHPDDRFTWDTHWAGDLDLVDYVHGRVTTVLDYQGLLGSEFRPFDPYQSNYLLEIMGTARVGGGVEVGGILNHVSRHLGDRFKRVAVAENSLGVRVWKDVEVGDQTQLSLRGDLRKVIARAYVDYDVMGDIDLLLRRTVNPRAQLYGRLNGQGILVDPAIAGRNRQYGGRAEVGVTLQGERGSVEFFAGVERMIDADPLDRTPRRWPFVGFRLRSR